MVKVHYYYTISLVIAPLTGRKKPMINDLEIETVTKIKYLGVIIDHKLCWMAQYAVAKISESIAILNDAKKIRRHYSLILFLYTPGHNLTCV